MTVLRSKFLSANKLLQRAAAGAGPVARGDKSDGVAMMQAALADLGYKLPRSTRPDKSMDGIFGAETGAVLRKFQDDCKLKADGLAGPKTLGAMDRLLLDKQSPATPTIKKPQFKRPRAPTSAPTPSPSPPTPPAMISDPYYKIGTADPPLHRDPGAGVWNSTPWTFTAAAQKTAIQEVMSRGLTYVYPGPNATKHLKHYFANHGRDLTIDLEDMIAATQDAKDAMVSEFRQVQHFIQKLPPGTHRFTAKSAESSYNYKEKTADWFFAIGGYSYWGKGTAKITIVNGQRHYEVDFEYKFFDRYNWDGGKSVTIAGVTITDHFMGEFHRQGLAKEFNCYGSVKRRFEWTGDVVVPQAGAIIRRPGR
jgi:peptidoglycan hydrolase-like protein with peptidoglycan-binding domain